MAVQRVDFYSFSSDIALAIIFSYFIWCVNYIICVPVYVS